MIKNLTNEMLYFTYFILNLVFDIQILISWGIQHFQVVGIILSCAYTLFLFILTCFIPKQIVENNNDKIPNVTHNHHPFQISDYNAHRIHILLQFIYTMIMLSFSMTGVFISIYNYHNCHHYNFFMEQNRLWDKTLTQFPPYVQEWAKAESNQHQKRQSNFVYFPSTGITILNGMKDDHDRNDGWMLWKLSNFDVPHPISEIRQYKSEFVSISNDTKCFTFKGSLYLDHHLIYNKTNNQTNIACSDDGQTFRFSMNTSIYSPQNLFVSDSTLWIQDMIHLDTKFSKKYIYSMNVSLMKETIHIMKFFDRTLSQDNYKNKEQFNQCAKNHILRHKAIRCLLFGIASVLLSIILWIYKHVPTVPSIIYLGISSISTSIYLIVYPDLTNIKSFCQWWFGISSALYLGLLFACYVTQRINSTTYKMSLSTISLIFLSSHISWIGIFESSTFNDNNGGEWYRWILINFVTFFPLIGIGTISEYTFVIALGFLGLFMDVWKIAYEFTERANYLPYYPIYFVLLAIAGGMIGSFAWMIHTYQKVLHQWVFTSFNANLESTMECHHTIRDETHASSFMTNETHQECESSCPC